MDHPVVEEIRQAVESPTHDTLHEQAPGLARVTDLHVWRVGKEVYSCAMTVVTRDRTLTAEHLRKRLSVHEEIVHSTIEVHHLPTHS
jgi:Co/Zn/Cd efflux system component